MANTAVSIGKIANNREFLEHFLKVNRTRLKLTYESLNNLQQDFLDVLPLLFQINHADLPGYVSEHTPSGISNYAPDNASLKALNRQFPEFKLQRRACLQMDILAMFCMGSSGTIAYSNKSDFDIWLIHAPHLSEDALQELGEKAALIEQWAEQLRLEVHFFIFDAQTFKNGQHDSLSTESSGTAQHYLLLDEFYRSSLLLAGCYPVWWLVPPDKEAEYEDYVQGLLQTAQIESSDFVDFGNVANIPADEFFSAAVWQLYKGLSSPFKSVLKLLLMEVYASEYPQIELLSMRYKKSIYQKETDFISLDPYIMLYKKIEEYLMIRMEKERIELFRKCFYFKLNLRMSQQVKASNSSWRRDLLQEMLLDWGWSQDKLTSLDAQEHWRINDVMSERKVLVKAFSDSYRFLSEFARRQSEVSRVSQTELNVLGRKLYAAFERKTSKIDIINRGIAPDIRENELSFIHAKQSDGQENWLVYINHIEKQELDKTSNKASPLKRCQSLIELLSWCHFNQIIDSNTAISVQSYNHSLDAKGFKEIFAAIDGLFPKGQLIKSDFSELNQAACIKKAGLFINIGLKTQIASDDETHYLAGKRVDALSYGGIRENLAKTFDLIISTSWEEILVYRYTGIKGLIQCLCDYLQWAPVQKGQSPPKVNCYSFASSYANTIARRIEQLFTSIINAYYSQPFSENTRYVLMIENQYFIFEHISGSLKYQEASSQAALTKALSTAKKSFSPVVFDNGGSWNSPLAKIYSMNQAQTIQMFFQVDNKVVSLYIIDEKGSLFTQTMPFYDSRSLINHFKLFFDSSIERRNSLLGNESMSSGEISIEFYLLDKNKEQTYRATHIELKPEPYTRNYLNIEVMGDLDDKQQTTLTVFCEDNEFSSLEYGNELFTVVARHVLEQRSSGLSYPIYITDIDLSRSLLYDHESENIQTLHFLTYKKRIEDKLNTALQSLT